MNSVPGAADVIVAVMIMVRVIVEKLLAISMMGRQEVRLVVGRQLGGRVGGGRRAIAVLLEARSKILLQTFGPC